MLKNKLIKNYQGSSLLKKKSSLFSSIDPIAAAIGIAATGPNDIAPNDIAPNENFTAATRPNDIAPDETATAASVVAPATTAIVAADAPAKYTNPVVIHTPTPTPTPTPAPKSRFLIFEFVSISGSFLCISSSRVRKFLSKSLKIMSMF